MEFDESKPYQPGDDVRHLDWRVTARTGKAHSKLFREERERPVFLWVDQRHPMFFATRGKFKSVIAAEIASLLAWSAAYHADRIGGILFSEQIHHELRPKRGKSAVLHLINKLVSYSKPVVNTPTAESATSASQAMLRLRRLVKPCSLVFLLSDFRNFDNVAESHLFQLSRHNDVVLVLIYDQLECELPPPGQYRVSDGQQDIVFNTYNRRLVESYRKQFVERKSRFAALSRTYKMPFLLCLTTDEPLRILRLGLNLQAST